MQIIVTLAGKGSRFSSEGFIEPKPAIQVGGRPALIYLIDSFPTDWSFIFVLAEHDRHSCLETIIKKNKPEAQVIYTNYSERGPIDTVTAALPFLKKDLGVLVTYCDVALIWSGGEFLLAVKNYDMAVVNYHGFHPTYMGPNSYCHVKVNSETHQVLQLQEKKLFTDQIENEITSSGVYYFRNKDILVEGLSQQLKQNLKYKDEYYVSFAIQALININKSFQILDYRVQQVVQFGTPADIERFEFWHQNIVSQGFQKKLVFIEDSKKPTQLTQEKFMLEKKYWIEVFKFYKMI